MGVAYQFKRVVLSILSYEGFLFAITLGSLIKLSKMEFLILIVFYTLIFLGIVVVKFIQFSRKGFYVRRS